MQIMEPDPVTLAYSVSFASGIRARCFVQEYNNPGKRMISNLSAVVSQHGNDSYNRGQLVRIRIPKGQQIF